MAKTPVVDVKRMDDGRLQISVLNAGSIVFDPTKAHADVRNYAAFHGFKQRFVDAAAMSRDTETGAPATPQEKYEAIEALVAWYESGTDKWSRVTEAGPRGGYLFEALCRVYGHKKAPSEIRAWLDGLSDKEQAALREDDAIEPVIRAIKAEKNAGKPQVDTKSILAGLAK